MKNKWAIAALAACTAFVSGRLYSFDQDLPYGRIASVPPANSMLFDYGRANQTTLDEGLPVEFRASCAYIDCTWLEPSGSR